MYANLAPLVGLVSVALLVKLRLFPRALAVVRRLFRQPFVVAVLLGAVLVLPAGPSPAGPGTGSASAEGACSKVIPVDALTDSLGSMGGAAYAFTAGGSGFTTTLALDATLTGAAAPVAAGPATAAGSTAGTVALGVGAFLAASYGTCKWLDWMVGDWLEVDPRPTVSHSLIDVGEDVRPCSELFLTTMPTSGSSTVTSTWRCVMMTFPAGTMPYDKMSIFDNRAISLVADGVTIPQLTFEPSGQYGTRGGSYDTAPVGKSNSSTGVNSFLWLSPSATYWCSQWDTNAASCQTAGSNVWPNMSRLVLAYPCTNNIGGFCGQHPDTIAHGRQCVNGTCSYTAFVVNPFPDAKEFGWYRRVITDVFCYGPGGGWVRSESAAYRDRRVSARIPVPSCPTGSMPTAIRSWRVPTGITCSLGATTCWNPEASIVSWTAPSTWTASAPPWVACLTTGADCGAPALSAGVCVWGGHTVPEGWCDTTRQAGTTANPVAMPASLPLTEPVIPADGDPASSVPEAGSETPPTTTVPGTGSDIPIDPGDGPRDTYDDGEDSPCVPSGWGWFNPVEWVLKPVKCALVWAFVPDSDAVAESWDELTAEAESAVPLAWVVKSYSVVSDASDGAAAAIAGTRDDCLTVIPDGGDLVDSEPGQLCPSSMAGVDSWTADVRPWLGLAVYLFFFAGLATLVFSKPAPDTQPQQLTLF